MFTYRTFQTIFVDKNQSGRLHGVILHCINSMLNDLFEPFPRQTVTKKHSVFKP